MIPIHTDLQHPTWSFLISLLISLYLSSCGPLPKEAEGNLVWLNLQLQSSIPKKIKRSGTATRGSELAIAVPASTQFSELGPEPSQALDWRKVNTLENTVSLRLPVDEPLQLFVYRYTSDESLIDLEQRMFSQTLHLNSIDFGQSDIFLVSSSGNNLSVNGQNSTTLTIHLARQLTGKISQNYVMGAQVWADRIAADGSFNKQLDENENYTNSGSDGSYSLAPDYLDYILATEGGFKLNASGVYVSAAPMLATIPDVSQMAVNITPLTTLVAAAPELAEIFEQSGDWRADIASPLGVPSDLLRVAKVTEAFWMLMSGGSNRIIETTQKQLSALAVLGQNLAEGGRAALQENLALIVGQAVEEVLNNPEISRSLSEDSKTIFNSELTNLATQLSELLPNNDQVIEDELLSEFDLLNESAFDAVQTVLCEFPESISVQFDPIVLSISLVPTSETTIAVRGTVSDDNFDALSTYWAIHPPDELGDSINPQLVNATVGADGYVETVLTIENWDHFGSVSLQLTECSPVDVISESCNWVPDSSQVNCNFME